MPIIGGKCDINAPEVPIGGKQTLFFLKCEQSLQSESGKGVWVVKSRSASPATTSAVLLTSTAPATLTSVENPVVQPHSQQQFSKSDSTICVQDKSAREDNSCVASHLCLQQDQQQPSHYLQCNQSSSRWMKKSCLEGQAFSFEHQTCIVPSSNPVKQSRLGTRTGGTKAVACNGHPRCIDGYCGNMMRCFSGCCTLISCPYDLPPLLFAHCSQHRHCPQQMFCFGGFCCPYAESDGLRHETHNYDEQKAAALKSEAGGVPAVNDDLNKGQNMEISRTSASTEADVKLNKDSNAYNWPVLGGWPDFMLPYQDIHTSNTTGTSLGSEISPNITLLSEAFAKPDYNASALSDSANCSNLSPHSSPKSVIIPDEIDVHSLKKWTNSSDAIVSVVQDEECPSAAESSGQEHCSTNITGISAGERNATNKSDVRETLSRNAHSDQENEILNWLHVFDKLLPSLHCNRTEFDATLDTRFQNEPAKMRGEEQKNGTGQISDAVKELPKSYKGKIPYRAHVNNSRRSNYSTEMGNESRTNMHFMPNATSTAPAINRSSIAGSGSTKVTTRPADNNREQKRVLQQFTTHPSTSTSSSSSSANYKKNEALIRQIPISNISISIPAADPSSNGKFDIKSNSQLKAFAGHINFIHDGNSLAGESVADEEAVISGNEIARDCMKDTNCTQLGFCPDAYTCMKNGECCMPSITCPDDAPPTSECFHEGCISSQEICLKTVDDLLFCCRNYMNFEQLMLDFHNRHDT
ncbi:unnamed protein product [Gongylonema pulchrum]|uniref:WAP domain-containing protein n=1 Tax=Gongylonema pulchrum TaxID=637853 RepID=A0A183CV80_9BILA|nr:unnamed protein product [Gongylonema pulchrum]